VDNILNAVRLLVSFIAGGAAMYIYVAVTGKLPGQK